MDEAGGVSYKARDKSSFFIRACVMVAESKFREVDEDITKRVISLLPTLGGERLPFHTAYIFHGSMGKSHGLWAHISEEKRREILYAMVQVIRENKLGVAYAVVNKTKMTEKYANPINPHIMSFVQAGELIENWTRENAPNHLWHPCVGQSDFDRDVGKLFTECRLSKPPFGKWAKQWKLVADVISYTTPWPNGIFPSKLALAADLCAFAVSRNEQQKENWNLFKYAVRHTHYNKYFPR